MKKVILLFCLTGGLTACETTPKSMKIDSEVTKSQIAQQKAEELEFHQHLECLATSIKEGEAMIEASNTKRRLNPKLATEAEKLIINPKEDIDYVPTALWSLWHGRRKSNGGLKDCSAYGNKKHKRMKR